MIIDLNTIPDPSDELYFPSEMTVRQFEALSTVLSSTDLIQETIDLDYFQNNLTLGANANLDEAKTWLKNSWNTEIVLNKNRELLSPGQSFALQWSFPQAYYSCFAMTLATFIVLGHTQRSHLAVLKHFGDLCSNDKYPSGMSFYADGDVYSITYGNITKPAGYHQFDFDVNDPNSAKHQVCQALSSTRKIQLKERAPKMKFKKADGSPKKSLSSAERIQVSSTIGKTTILNLLYRKRIKANYLDIDTFTYAGLRAIDLNNALCEVVSSLNEVNELLISKAIGKERLREILNQVQVGNTFQPISERLNNNLDRY